MTKDAKIQTNQIGKTEIKLLNYVAMHPGETRNQINTATKKEKRVLPNTIREINNLVNRGFVEKLKLITVRGSKRPTFELSIKGLVFVLSIASKEEIKTIAEKNSEKLFLFEKMPLFEKAGVADRLIENLAYFLKRLDILRVMSPELMEPADDPITIQQAVLDSIVYRSFLPLIEQSSEEVMSILKADSEMDCYIADFILEGVKDSKVQLDYFQRLEKIWVTGK